MLFPFKQCRGSATATQCQQTEGHLGTFCPRDLGIIIGSEVDTVLFRNLLRIYKLEGFQNPS